VKQQTLLRKGEYAQETRNALQANPFFVLGKKKYSGVSEKGRKRNLAEGPEKNSRKNACLSEARRDPSGTEIAYPAGSGNFSFI